MNLFDTMRRAGDGAGFSAMAEHFGLGGEEMQKAVEALMPAYAAGLQRAMTDPTAFLPFMQHFASGALENFYRRPETAWTGLGAGEGEALLELLFPPPPLRRAIAEQAKAATGLSAATFERMMPATTAILMGGLASRFQAAAEAYMQALVAAPAGKKAQPTSQEPAGAKGPLDRYEDEQSKSERRESAASPASAMTAAWFDMAEKMAQGAFPEAAVNAWAQVMQPAFGAAGASESGTGDHEAAAAGDAFADMVRSGGDMSRAYLNSMQKLFERYAGKSGSNEA